MATEINKNERKKEREKARRAEKRELMAWRIGIAAVALAFVIGLGVTFVNMFRNYQDTKPNYDRTEMVVTDLSGVLTATTAAEPETVTEPATEAAPADTQAETPAATQAEAPADTQAETPAVTQAETPAETQG